MQTEQARGNVRGIENQIGLKAKRELIRSIQEKRGEAPCFQTGRKFCDHYECRWRGDCMPGGA